MKKVAIIQARMGSIRFPGKVLYNLVDRPVISWVVEAAKRIPLIDQVIVATTDHKNDQAIVKWCEENNIEYFCGNEHDVLDRYYATAKKINADIIMRITADCPLLDSAVAGQVLLMVALGYADYATNTVPATWPDGLDCEAFTFKALEVANQNSIRGSDREHVTPYIRNNQHLFKIENISCPFKKASEHRWTVDSKEDLDYLNTILYGLKSTYVSYVQLIHYLSKTNIQKPSKNRNEGFDKSLEQETVFCEKFTISQNLLKRAKEVIPLGSQTFSKSYIQYPENNCPLFLTHGNGYRTWDVDGNEYIDLVNALMPNILGYADPDVNYSIQAQLQKGIILSLATELEIKLAEKLCSIIPCAEKVRFAKNGSDVTAAAVRLARAYTGRDNIIACGYHGWQDWYIGSTSRNKGVPKQVSELTSIMPYNDLNKVEELLRTERYAAIIMEPCNATPPNLGYLENVKLLCEKFGSLLIFDEIITGFRFALGGAQEYFNVTPHLACFGKAMGNGMPISAIVGRNDIMAQMEEIFFSGTFGGETLSIISALETIEKIQNCSVIEKLWNVGNKIDSIVANLAKEYELDKVISFHGYAPWKIIKFESYKDIDQYEIRTLFSQEIIKNGILVLASHNISYVMDELCIEKIHWAYKKAFDVINFHIKNNTVSNAINSPIIKPIFNVR